MLGLAEKSSDSEEFRFNHFGAKIVEPFEFEAIKNTVTAMKVLYNGSEMEE